MVSLAHCCSLSPGSWWSSRFNHYCNDVQKSFHIAISAIIFSFLLGFELDFGENVVFVMLLVWAGSCWRLKMQGLVLMRSNLKCLCSLPSSPRQFVPYLQGLNSPPRLGLCRALVCGILHCRLFPVLYPLRHVSVQSDFPLLSSRVFCCPSSAPGKAATDLTASMARQLPKQ